MVFFLTQGLERTSCRNVFRIKFILYQLLEMVNEAVTIDCHYYWDPSGELLSLGINYVCRNKTLE